MMRKLLCVFAAALLVFAVPSPVSGEENAEKPQLKWVDFTIPASAMAKAMDYDIKSYGGEQGEHIDWIALLALSGARYGGNWNSYKAAEMDKDARRLSQGEKPEEILVGYKNYDYHYAAYKAVLGEYLGAHLREVPDKENPGLTRLDERYGLKAYSPVAEGYGYSHYKDFGVSRSYGYRRQHFGNDLTGTVGTPIIAVEGGVVEELGWNQYGGWRVGIRSHDSLRYYYYAHLRKDHPWPEDMAVGMTVQGGDVIGYMGMTGYSVKENVNGMNTPHLHFGLQLVFDESKKDAPAQNWIDVYELVELLRRNRATVVRVPDSKDYRRKYNLYDYHYASGE